MFTVRSSPRMSIPSKRNRCIIICLEQRVFLSRLRGVIFDAGFARIGKYPEQVVIVTTSNGNRKNNAMAVGWVCIVSSEPWMFALGIDSEALTYRLIKKNRDFVVAHPSDKMAKETLFVGTHHGKDAHDKLAQCGLAASSASVVKAPLLRDAVANFECRLHEIYQPGDCPVIIGRIVAAHVNKNRQIKRLLTVGSGYQLGGVETKKSK